MKNHQYLSCTVFESTAEYKMAYKPEIEMDCHYFDDDVGKSVAEIVESLGKELNEFFSDFSG